VLSVRVGRIVAWGLAIAAVSAAPASAFTAEQKQAMEGEVQAAMQQTGYPGMLVGVWTKGQGSFISTPGVADIATGREMRFSDQARIGSITKTFTATVVLQLAEEGRLGLDDHVKKFVRPFPRGGEVTIRMLLNHTSGIPTTPTGVANAAFSKPHHNWLSKQVDYRCLRQKRLSPPGAEWHYSDCNYLLLGAIAEQLTGESLRKLYRERISEPLGLTGTTYRAGADGMPAGAAHGYYVPNPPGVIDTFGWNFSWASSAGAMVSTLSDLHRYGPALATGRGLLSKRMQRQRLQLVDTGTGIFYGLGIFAADLGTTTSEPYLGHDGIVPGYDSIALYSPVTKTTIAIIGTTAVEIDNFPNDALRPTLFDLADVLAAIVQGEPVAQ
jgi:D-alanyl-D-alanine carboxypeptidase